VSKPLIFYRFALAGDVLSEMENNPKEFLYGADGLIKEGKVDALFVSKGKRNTLLRKLLYLIEKPVAMLLYLGMPLEIVLENWSKVKKASVIYCINDAISFAVLFFKWLGLLNVPVIALLQSTSERHRKYFGKNKLAVWFVKKLIHQADLILTLSRPAMNEIIEKFEVDPKKIRPFYFGVDKEYWHEGASERDDYILSVGNDHNRDFNTLINSLSEKYKIKLVTKLSIQKYSNVEVLKGVSNEELRELYQKAALVVTPSRYVKTESSGLSVTLQSMACGATVVASESLPFKEIFDDNNIYYYEPGNIEGLREVVDLLMNDRSKTFECGSLARKTVAEKYNSAEMGRSLESIIDEVLLR